MHIAWMRVAEVSCHSVNSEWHEHLWAYVITWPLASFLPATQASQSVIIYRFILCQRVAGGAVPISATSGDRRGTPWTVRQSIAGPHTDRDKQPFTLTLTPMVNLECPIYLIPTLHVFGLWEEAGEPGENPRTHGENMQTPCRKALVPTGARTRVFSLQERISTTYLYRQNPQKYWGIIFLPISPTPIHILIMHDIKTSLLLLKLY